MTELIQCLDLRKNLQLLIPHEMSPFQHFAVFFIEVLVLGRAVLRVLGFVNYHL